jgi:hypothetical protein
MRSSRCTNTPSAETSVVLASTNVLHWQGIFTTFLKDASTALSRPHFYLIQASHWGDSGGGGRVDGGSSNNDGSDVSRCSDVDCGGNSDSNSDRGDGNLHSNGSSGGDGDSNGCNGAAMATAMAAATTATSVAAAMVTAIARQIRIT